MGTQVNARAADNRSLAAIGMSLGFAALFATTVAAFLVTAEVQALSNTPQQISLLK
jgi:H+/Cl- antiporter ClcA